MANSHFPAASTAAAKSLQSCPTLFDSHRQQPTRLPRPWDSPVKNTGVGCHFRLQCMKVKSESEVAQSCLTLSDPMAVAHQAPPSMGFSRQDYWSGLYQLNFRYIFWRKKKDFYLNNSGFSSKFYLYYLGCNHITSILFFFLICRHRLPIFT